MQDQIREKVIEIICNLNKIPKESIDPDISYRDAGLDSFAFVEAIYSIENHYDITFEQDFLLLINTVNDLVEVIEKTIKAKELAEKEAKNKEAADK